MPVDPVNGPVIFVIFIHVMDVTWKELATSKGIFIGAKTGTRIVVGDIFSWAPIFDDFINYLTCQLQVCLSQNLSLSLKKCLFCPEIMEFVGYDVCTNGNRPTQSKHSLLKSWPVFKIARDVFSFFGFMNFYATYIPWFEERASPLRELAKLDMLSDIEPLVKEDHFKAREDLIMAILSDPASLVLILKSVHTY